MNGILKLENKASYIYGQTNIKMDEKTVMDSNHCWMCLKQFDYIQESLDEWILIVVT